MKILLFHKSNILGGAETLIIRTAQMLSNIGYKVIVCVVNGFYNEYISDLDILDISLNKYTLECDDIIITFPIYIRSLDRYFEHYDNRVLYWTVHFYNLRNFYPFISTLQRKSKLVNYFVDKVIFRKRYLRLKKQIKAAINHKMLFFMDVGVKNHVLDYYNFMDNMIRYNSILPIPVSVNKFNSVNFIETTKKITQCKKIRVGFIGRLDRFKVFPINKVLSDFIKIKEVFRGYEFIFKVIGAGNDKNLIEIPACLVVDFVGEIEYSKLFDYVKEEIDLVFAMGTTALEAALCLKPVILLDVMYNKCDFNYKYRYIYESRGYSLGELVENENDVFGKHSLLEVIDSVINNYEEIAVKSNNYVILNHSEINITKQLTLIFGDLK